MAKIIRVWDGSAWQEVGTALPNALTTDGTQTLTNKTINLTSNTLTGTTAQFNTALSDANFTTLAGSETLTNKSIALGSNTITGTIDQFNTALTDANFATAAGSETLTNKTISGADNTLTNIANASLTNSSITINGSAVSLGGSTTISGLPSQTSNSGKYLTTDGTTSSWANVTNLVPIDSNISVPNAPTSVSATIGNTQSIVSFVDSTDNGGSTILGYTVISSPGSIKKSGTTSPITITGLTNGTAYTFTVKAHNIAGSSAASTASSSITPAQAFNVDYLVVAGGGGGGGTYSGGGGGAGGLRSTVTATGGGGSLETALTMSPSTNYTVTVGAGGASKSTAGAGNDGSNSVFSTITSIGGGGGGANAHNGRTGGSGGGSGATNTPSSPGTGTANQGFNGGIGFDGTQGCTLAGGGGGAGAVGGAAAQNCNPATGGAGGNGVAVSITGSSVTYAGGGGGNSDSGPGGGGAGGTGGGGAGGRTQTTEAISGTANTGGGGGGSASGPGNSGAGGSGIVILRYPDTITITIGAGLTGTESSPSGGYKRATITAGTGNVSWV